MEQRGKNGRAEKSIIKITDQLAHDAAKIVIQEFKSYNKQQSGATWIAQKPMKRL
jgi:hypothetical protein